MIRTKEIAGEKLGFNGTGDALGLGSSAFVVYQVDGQTVAFPDKCLLAGQAMVDFLDPIAHIPTRNSTTKRDLGFALRALPQFTDLNRISTVNHSSTSLKKAHEASPHVGEAMTEFLAHNSSAWLKAVEYEGIDRLYKRLKGLRVYRNFEDLINLTLQEATRNILGVEENNERFDDKYLPRVWAINLLTHTLTGDETYPGHDALADNELAKGTRKRFIDFIRSTPNSKKPAQGSLINYFMGEIGTAFHNRHTYQSQAELILAFLNKLKVEDSAGYNDFVLRIGDNRGWVSVDLGGQRFYNSSLKSETVIGPSAVKIYPDGVIGMERTGRTEPMIAATIDASQILRGGEPTDWRISDLVCDEGVSERALVPVVAFGENGFLNQSDTNSVLEKMGAKLLGRPDVFLGRILVESQMPKDEEKPMQLIDLPIERSSRRAISPRELPIWVSSPFRSQMLLQSEMVKVLS